MAVVGCEYISHAYSALSELYYVRFSAHVIRGSLRCVCMICFVIHTEIRIVWFAVVWLCVTILNVGVAYFLKESAPFTFPQFDPASGLTRRRNGAQRLPVPSSLPRLFRALFPNSGYRLKLGVIQESICFWLEYRIFFVLFLKQSTVEKKFFL